MCVVLELGQRELGRAAVPSCGGQLLQRGPPLPGVTLGTELWVLGTLGWALGTGRSVAALL